MTSTNRNIFSVTGPFCREFTGHRWIRLTTRSFDIFFDLRLNKCLSIRHAGDLRRHRAHYDVTEMNPSTPLMQSDDDTYYWPLENYPELWWITCSANYVFLIYVIHLLCIASTNYEGYSPAKKKQYQKYFSITQIIGVFHGINFTKHMMRVMMGHSQCFTPTNHH